jgi:hypothetical protein
LNSGKSRNGNISTFTFSISPSSSAPLLSEAEQFVQRLQVDADNMECQQQEDEERTNELKSRIAELRAKSEDLSTQIDRLYSNCFSGMIVELPPQPQLQGAVELQVMKGVC